MNPEFEYEHTNRTMEVLGLDGQHHNLEKIEDPDFLTNYWFFVNQIKNEHVRDVVKKNRDFIKPIIDNLEEGITEFNCCGLKFVIELNEVDFLNSEVTVNVYKEQLWANE